MTAVHENLLWSHVSVDEAECVDDLQGLDNRLGMGTNLKLGEKLYFLVFHGFYQVALVPVWPDDVDEVSIDNVLEHRDQMFLFDLAKMALQGKLRQLLVARLWLLDFLDDFESVELTGSFMPRLHGCAAHLLDYLVLIDLACISLRLHDAHHYAFTVCLVGEVNDLFRFTGQVDSDREDQELVVGVAVSWFAIRWLNEDLRVVASICCRKINAQLLYQFFFGELL